MPKILRAGDRGSHFMYVNMALEQWHGRMLGTLQHMPQAGQDAGTVGVGKGGRIREWDKGYTHPRIQTRHPANERGI